MMVGVASAAPIAVLPTAILSKPLVALPSTTEPTKISKLHAAYQAMRREYKAAQRKRRKLEAEIARRLPTPHLSIVYSPENDADGLACKSADGKPHTINCHIRSFQISNELEKLDVRDLINESKDTSPNDKLPPPFNLAEVKAMYEELDEIDRRRVSMVIEKLNQYRPLSDSDLALRDRLGARLKLSKEYEQKIRGLQREVGLTQLEQKIENRILPRLSAIQRRIFAEPAATQTDLRVKLALYEAEAEYELSAEELLRDFRRVVQSEPHSPVIATFAGEAVQS